MLLCISCKLKKIDKTQIDVIKLLSNYNRKEFHHIFPVAYLKDKNFHCNPNSVCNIIILSASENKSISAKAPSIYFTKIKEELTHEFQLILQSNFIPSDNCSGLWQDDYDFFAESRAELLKSEVEQLFI